MRRILPRWPSARAGDDHHLVAFFNMKMAHNYMTSGAREMIFMNFWSRNSRATGPKMRVPRGLFSLSIMTMALLSNRRYEPSERRICWRVRTSTASTTSPFLDGAVRRGLLDVRLDDVADAGVALVAADDADGGGPLGAGVVSHVYDGSNL